MKRDNVRRTFRLGTGATDRDVDDEIGAHIDQRVEQLVAAGMSPADARDEALRRFGQYPQAVRDLHDAAHQRDRRIGVRDRFDAWMMDVRYALRSVVREPAFSIFIVVTLALGIGANAAMYGVVDRLLVRGPEHVRDADELIRLYTRAVTPWAGELTWDSMGYVSYLAARDNTSTFSSVAAYAVNGGMIGRQTSARPIRIGWVTADFFPTLGVQPINGRFFTAAEDAPGAASHVAVISRAMWNQEFGGAPIDGLTVVLNGNTYEVIGVAPHGFTGVGLAAVDAWAPMSVLSANVTNGWERSWDAQWLRVIGRLKPGVSAEQAGVVATLARRAAYTGSQDWEREATMVALPISYSSLGTQPQEARVARWLVGVAVIVLLVACANTANLLLARAVRRRREFAVRAALGSGRARLARLVIAEGTALALCAGVAGIAVAYAVGSVVRRTLLPNIEWTSSPVGWRVMVALALVALVTGLVASLLPAVHASGRGLATALRTGVRDGGGNRARARSVLAIAQAALSVVLLVGAGLFVRSLWAIHTIDMGIEPARVLVARIPAPSLPPPQNDEEFNQRLASRRASQMAMLDSARNLPGVERASLAVGLAFNTAFTIGLRVPGLDSIPSLPGGGPYVHAVTSDYFETMGQRVLAGRGFTPADREGSEPVAIVSDLMARTLWPGRSALGECLILSEAGPETCARVVGIAENARRDGIREDAAMMFYVPFGQERGFGGTALLVRPAGNPDAMHELVRGAIRAHSPDANYIGVERLSASLDPQIRPWRLGATMFSLCGALALLVAAIGLYSVMSYSVAQRSHEFAVRTALGAQPTDITRLIMSSGVGLAAFGVVLGLGAAWAGARLAQPLLFDTSATDPLVYATVAAVLLGVALLACAIPAQRARRITPASALRVE